MDEGLDYYVLRDDTLFFFFFMVVNLWTIRRAFSVAIKDGPTSWNGHWFEKDCCQIWFRFRCSRKKSPPWSLLNSISDMYYLSDYKLENAYWKGNQVAN